MRLSMDPMTLYMHQMTLDERAFMAFASEQGLDSARDELDLGYLGHAWLRAAFGELAPKPWRLLMERGARRPPRILCYSEHPQEALKAHMRRYATPGVEAVCPPERIVGKALPKAWPAGRPYGFEVLCCPIGRKSRDGSEKDLFLMAADHEPEARLDRGGIYARWLGEQFGRVDGVEMRRAAMEGFRLSKVLRKTQDSSRHRARRVRPHALMRGTFIAQDPAAVPKLLHRGVGRHRAFGFGMILLRPA